MTVQETATNGIRAAPTSNGLKEQPYTLQAEAARIFELIVNDQRLNVPDQVKELASTVHFGGDETQPFYPVPFKAAETQAALCGYMGLLASAISKARYGVEQKVHVDV